MNKYSFKPTGILHVGASTGQEAESYKSAGVKDVIWIEAIPEVFKELIRHLENVNCHEGAICLNACIGDVDQQDVEFNVSSHGAQSSSMFEFGTHLACHPEISFINKIKLKTIRLDTLLQGVNMYGFDFLNIDLQGAELLALKSMGDLLEEFQYAYLELNRQETYKGCALVEDIDRYMKGYGFERVETSAWIGDTWADGFFIKAKTK